jgi:hyperosmotically inducible protein
MQTSFNDRFHCVGAIKYPYDWYRMGVTGAMAAERSTGQAIDDTLITTKVKANFAADPQVSALAITVETTNGVVTLSGVVENEAERQRAIQLAQGMEGVTRVDANKLPVKR